MRFDVPAGSTVAVVGAFGAGMSTCVDLLLRFWDRAGGVIRVDGRDLRGVLAAAATPVDHRRSQDNYLYNGTSVPLSPSPTSLLTVVR
ncbi:ATP-binding cassette domain-containing protein [Nocardia vinacea]|uniref:ATP-binding cassette domain-containing protein n=1 Tax=Nocardia vinacea TaxID=96468 RepID=UPI0033F7B55A